MGIQIGLHVFLVNQNVVSICYVSQILPFARENLVKIELSFELLLNKILEKNC